MARGVRMRKYRYAVTHSGGTDGDGPFWYGLCGKNLTVAELDEAIDADPNWEEDTPAFEQVQRHVVVLGSIGQNADEAQEAITPWRTGRWYWDNPENEGIQFFVRNQDTAALQTGMVVKFQALFMGEWLRE